MSVWRWALLLAAVPVGAVAQPLSNTVDPSSVVPPPQSASTPIQMPERGSGSPQDTTPRFTLTGVEFDGARTLSPEALRPAWAPFQNKAVSLADLHSIARRAELAYADAGYPFVAIVLTPQKVEDGGVVRFKVVEGRISSLTVLSNDSVARRQTAVAFGGLVNREPLSSAAVESDYRRGKAIPGLTIDGALRRGAVPGGMDLVVRARHEDWRIYANTNNLYPETVGPWGVLFGVDHFGSSPYGDQTSLQLYSSVSGGEQQVARLSHRQVLTASGSAISGLILVARAKPGGVIAPLDLATNVTAGRLEYSRPIFQRLSFGLGGSAAFEANDQDTKVFSSVALTNDRLRILSLALHGDAESRNGSTLQFDVELRQGIEGLNASQEGDLNLSRTGANPQATVGRFSATGLSPYYRTVRLYGRVEAQWAGSPLTAPEQFAIGNLSIGRGFEPGASFGDHAVAASAEVRFGPYSTGRFRVQPYAFYDAASLWSLTPAAHRDHSIASTGLGVRFEAPGRMHLDLSYAAPLTSAMDLGDPRPDPKVLVKLTVGLDDILKWGRRGGRSGGSK